MKRLLTPLALCLAACAAGSAAGREPLGDRVRVRIAGRGDEPSITSADHRVFVVLIAPDGRREELRVFSPTYGESESLTASIGIRAGILFGFDKPTWPESLQGDPQLCHDLLLPPGYSVCFEPGSFYVCRREPGTDRFVADPDPEIRVGQITADGSRYLEVPPAIGVTVGFDDDPPGWAR